MDTTAAYRMFMRIVELGSLSAAAQDIGVSQPAVSKLLRNFEAHLGVRLLERGSRTVRPTSQGLTIYEACRTAFSILDTAVETIKHEMNQVSGHLRIHAPICLGEQHLSRIILEFQTMHPTVTVDFTLANRVVDLMHENFDLAFQMGRPTDPSVVMKKIGHIRRIMVATPSYIEEHPSISTPQALIMHKMLVTEAILSPQNSLTLCKRNDCIDIHIKPLLKTNNSHVLIKAIEAGKGIGAVQQSLVADKLKQGKLVHVLPDYEIKASELYLTYPSAKFMRPSVRAFIDFAVPALRAVAGIF